MEYTEKEFTPNKIYDYIKHCGLSIIGQELIKGNEHMDKHEFIDRLEKEINYTRIKYNSKIYGGYSDFQLKIMFNIFDYDDIFCVEPIIKKYFKAITHEYVKEMHIENKVFLYGIDSDIFLERLDASKHHIYRHKNMDKKVKIRYEIK